jgi:hypothetical protein
MNSYRARKIAEMVQVMNEIDADITAMEDAFEAGAFGPFWGSEFLAARKRLAALDAEWRYASDCCDKLRNEAAAA